MTLLKKNIYYLSSTLLIALALVFTTSCTKDEGNPSGSATINKQSKTVTDKPTKLEMERLAKEMPALAWYNTAMNKIVTFDPKKNSKSFDFSDPNPGWNFSDASETQWVPSENGGGILFIGYGSFGSNTGSGTVVAGNTALNINSTFCFSASDDALGLDLVDLGNQPNLDGISGVIGISGDFEALANQEIDDNTNIFDYFHGLAYYVVYDNEAHGNYNILNWFDNLDSQDMDNLSGKGFSWVYGFSAQEWSIYFSKNGSLNVSGGSMNFDGNYLGISFNFENLMNGDGDFYDFTYEEQSGYGEMGCN